MRFGLVLLIICCLVGGGYYSVERSFDKRETQAAAELKIKMQKLASEAERLTKPVAGEWKLFDDLSWAFNPAPNDWTSKKRYATLMDLALYSDGTIKPYQLRRPGDFEPVPVWYKNGPAKRDSIIGVDGVIVISARQPDELTLACFTYPLRSDRSRMIEVKARHPELVPSRYPRAFDYDPKTGQR